MTEEEGEFSDILKKELGRMSPWWMGVCGVGKEGGGELETRKQSSVDKEGDANTTYFYRVASSHCS